ncbi:transmembrane protease serine 9-like isoform X2 [Adelges cooleyi]|nr:transmembrane protease serine 9-like isoform X2 [Adelges cooleyi]
MWSTTDIFTLTLLSWCATTDVLAHKNVTRQGYTRGDGDGQWSSTDTRTHRCKPCSCGVGYPGMRIVGGSDASDNQYPWMVSLWNAKRKFFCGGSVITDQYVMTAAHCFSEEPATSFREIFVMMGQTRRPGRLVPGLSHTIKASVVKLHPGYSPTGASGHDNDIALIKLTKPIKFNRTLQSICLPTTKNDYSGQTGMVAGWGQLSELSGTSLSLRHTTIPIWSNRECATIPEYVKPGYTSNMICAGFKVGGKDSCQGDSGGPLMVYDAEDKITVAGIVSWGIGCGAPKLPGVYTRVDNYLGWIARNTKDSCRCTS